MKRVTFFLALILFGISLSAQNNLRPKPYALLHPPQDITPAKTMYNKGWESTPLIAPMQWTASEHSKLEKKLSWFHKAKYGLFFHFLAPQDCTPEKWNAMVNAVDVEKFADQVKKAGAGYVVLTIGQNQLYSCAPNPVLEKLWDLKPNTYISKRDLPMDVYKALNKRDIKFMLYMATDNQYKLPLPKSFTKETDRFENWLKVLEWYSNHYGRRCLGWWIDGLNGDYNVDYRHRVHNVLKTGNPDAIIASSTNALSEFTNGHCDPNWEEQQRYRKPYYGRWDPVYKIQWHVLQYLGSRWAQADTAHSTLSIVNYASDVVKGGGVITFDVGTFEIVDGKPIQTFLDIPEGQMKQLIAVKNALKMIKPSEGSDKKSK